MPTRKLSSLPDLYLNRQLRTGGAVRGRRRRPPCRRPSGTSGGPAHGAGKFLHDRGSCVLLSCIRTACTWMKGPTTSPTRFQVRLLPPQRRDVLMRAVSQTQCAARRWVKERGRGWPSPREGGNGRRRLVAATHRGGRQLEHGRRDHRATSAAAWLRHRKSNSIPRIFVPWLLPG